MEVPDKLLEDERVNVLAELVEQEPVADLEPPADCLNLTEYILIYPAIVRLVLNVEYE